MQKNSVTKRQQRGRDGWHQGHRAETVAAWWLRLKGYRILARRWRSPMGEIDLIALRRGVLVAVEVKARPTRAQGLEAIRPAQQARLIAALGLFAAQSRSRAHSMRLDALVISPKSWPYHVADAWRA